MTSDEPPEDLIKLVAAVFRTPKEEWWVRDLGDSYPWLRSGSVTWVIDPETDDSAMVLRRTSGALVRLDGRASLPVIADVIATDLGERPERALGVENLAELLREWHEEPRGYVMTPGFLDREHSELESWLQGSEKSAAVFESFCRTPSFEREEGGGWTLSFNVIDRKGGIALWTARGTRGPFRISVIERKPLRPAGTFYFPEEL